ncbi:ABC transporter [Microdochium trichocladiopsis]|uniref:ABC transporter n=1 Tax=Microdochium trichocladiopsis TaxID=1682393 RepID=A0A9P9BLU9_9PEZI|nr:ABC transporter [Microdochium trichocladiopsis]KAH7025269.1 ABC transporter [Microdochium trichocladiopsis]
METVQLSVCPDNTLGPWAGPGCRGGFDFTLLFEEAALSLPVHAVFLLAVPVRILQLVRLPTRASSGPLRVLKAISAVSLAALNIALVGLWARDGGYAVTNTRASTANAVLAFVASVAVCALTWLEHDRSRRPASLLSIYLYLSVLLDLARTRTLWLLDPGSSAIAALFTTTLVMRLVTAALESFQKGASANIDDKVSTPEAIRGPLSTATFTWLLPLLRGGYRKVFSVNDLYPVDEWLSSKDLHETLQREWEKVPNKAAPNALLFTWLRVFAGAFWAPAVPRLFIIAFTYAQPFLIQAAVEFASAPKGMPYDNYGYGLIGAFFLVYAGMAISVGQFYWRLRRMISMTRSSVVGLIFNESLLIDPHGPGANPLGALTLANADTDAAQQGLYQAHDLWSSIVEIVIADYLIWRQMGAACAVPIAVAVLAVVVSSLVAAPTGAALGVWLVAIQERVVKTATTLGAVKWMKMAGLADPAFQGIRNLRLNELKVSLKYRILAGGSMVVLMFAPVWSPILTFSLYTGLAARDGTILSPATIFTAYSLISLLSGPLLTLTLTIPVIFGSIAAFGRIQAFLNGQRRTDTRNLVGEGPALPHVDVDPSKMLDTSTVHTIAKTEGSSSSNDTIATLQGTFRWTADAEPVLDIQDLRIPRKKVTVILGPVGCGKSTLLKAILGELCGFEGTIRTNYAGVAYCDQNPWIPNDTVRRLITGWGEIDETWYQRVLKASELQHDLGIWPAGDQTQTASAGLAMSGGQKHRLALARAVYSGKELIVLDDLFKTLDASTESRVLENLWGTEGFLRASGTSTILASSDDKHMAYADYVVALDEKGHVKAEGSPEEVSEVLGIPAPQRCAPITEQAKEEKSSEATLAPTSASPAAPVAPVVDEEFTEQARRLGDKGTLREYAFAAGWPTLIMVALSLAAYAFCGSFPTIWLGWWAEQSALDPYTPIGKWLGIYVLLGVGSLAGAALAIWLFMVVIINKCGVIFHERLLNAVSKAPLSFFSSVDAGTTLNRFSEDIRLIDMEVPTAVYGMGTTGAVLLAQFAILAYITKYIAVVIPILALVFYFVQHFYLRTSRQLRLLDIELKAPVSSKLLELSSGLVSIRAFQWHDKMLDQSLAVLDESQIPCYLLGSVQCWLNFSIEMMMLVLALVFIVITTVLRQDTGAVNMGVGLTSLLSINGSVKLIINFWVMLENALGAIARVSRFSKVMDKDEAAGTTPRAAPQDPKWPAAGVIEVRDIVASYPSSGVCLDKISFTVNPGQKIAVCGRTGSGKSSLVLCLLGMMDTDTGSVVIDGVDIATLPRDYVPTRVVACPQEAHIMHDTIRRNVDPLGVADDAKIRDVLERVQLWATAEAVGGLDTVIFQEALSPGQAQLLVLARAMLRDSKILILDEPTRSLDATMTELVRGIINDWFANWTVISVTHNVDDLLDYDAVAVLDDGKLVSYGPHVPEPVAEAVEQI